MALKIRLTRMGDKKAPFYRVVVADSRYPRDGRSSKKSALTIPALTPLRSRSIWSVQMHGSRPVLSPPRPSEAC